MPGLSQWLALHFPALTRAQLSLLPSAHSRASYNAQNNAKEQGAHASGLYGAAPYELVTNLLAQ